MNTYKTNCPVCGEIIEVENYSSSWGTEEEYILCPRCNYAEAFVYGNLNIAVGNKLFYRYHSDDRNYINLMNRRCSKALFMARRNWKKHHKKTTTQLMI